MAGEKHYDFIVIGSGTSGGTAAYMLQHGGMKGLLLEAGSYFKKEDFTMSEEEYTPKLFWGGGCDFNKSFDLAFIRGRCVGGGSVINQALMDRFDDTALNDWKADTGIDFFTRDGMDAHYNYAENQIVRQEIPSEWRNKNAHKFIEGMENIGREWKPMVRAQCDCATPEGQDCICCLGGCLRGSKQSTLETAIPRAEAEGLEIQAEITVEHIEYKKEGVTVHAVQHGAKKVFHAAKVVLAAGALGTSQLLLNSGFSKALPTLGHKFCMHPQFMNFAIFDEIVDSHKGALQGCKSDDPVFRKRGFKLENVFAPPIAVGILHQRLGAKLIDFLRQYRNFACIEVCVRDENTGILTTDKHGRIKIEKKLTDQDKSRCADGRSMVHQLFDSLKPKEIFHADWPFGLHLMGGCCIGQDGASSVVNPAFQVHGHENLYCADSSVFPNAPGINPGLTIFAMSHRMASSMLEG